MVIVQDVIDILWVLCQDHAPKEVCGVLFSEKRLELEFRELCLMTNHAPEPEQEFWMNPKELFELIRQRPTKTAMLWHSHPTSRWNLSPHDGRLMVQTQLPMAIVAAQPYPSVVVYEFHDSGSIRMAETYRVTGAPTRRPNAVDTHA